MTLIFSIAVNSLVFAQQNSSNSTNQSIGNETDVTLTLIQASIAPGAPLLTETAYNPNPNETSVDQTIIWTNEDTVFHTVTSGESGEEGSGQIFDSGLTGANAMTSKDKTFEHKFDKAGEYPYYCILHPDMIDTVIVT